MFLNARLYLHIFTAVKKKKNYLTWNIVLDPINYNSMKIFYKYYQDTYSYLTSNTKQTVGYEALDK